MKCQSIIGRTLAGICLGMMIGRGLADERPAPRVLLLYSNDQSLPANLRIDKGFRETLGKGLGERYELFTESLDAARFPGEERNEAMDASLRVRYRERPPDVLVAIAPEALDFFLNRRQSLFPGTPLIFGGVEREMTPGSAGSDVAGLLMSIAIAPTLELALKLRPRTREVFVVTGGAEADRQREARARADFQPFESQVKVTYWNALPFVELTHRAAGLPSDALVFYYTYFAEPDGTPMQSPSRALELLSAKCNAPIFGPYHTYVGKGIVGGLVSDFADEGAETGKLVLRILSGEAPSQIGILKPLPAEFHFDARQLERWKIPLSQLPEGSRVDFRTPGLWEEHPRTVTAAIVVMLVQAALIAGLLIHRARRFRSEAALAASEERIDLAAQKLGLGFWIWNPATGYSWTSDKLGVLLGYAPDEKVTLDNFLQHVVPEDRARVEEAVKAKVAQLADVDLEYRTRLPDGSVRWINLCGRCHQNAEGTFQQITGMSRDITARRQAAMEAEQQRQELAHLSRVAALSSLTGSLAHELNQPLGSILSNAQAAQHVLSAEPLNLSELREILADIISEDRRAGDVIRRLRTMLRRGEVAHQPVNVNENIGELLRLTRSDLNTRGVEVSCQLAGDLPAAMADRVQLQQVMLNLIMNACDAMESNPPENRKLTLTTFAERNEVRIGVLDCGVGLPEDVETLFQPFHTTREGGLGMGLSICRTLVAAHGGRLWAEPRADRGAAFYVALTVAEETT